MKKRLQTRGFTLAEILITLVIIGFVAALGVPMLGQQKVKTPSTPKEKHGTVECFYSDGVLYQYEADNIDNKDGTLSYARDYCTIKLPSASRFVFQAIGAGGNGAGMHNSDTNEFGMPYRIMIPKYTSTTTPVEGIIQMGTGFIASIEGKDVPDWVRNEWNKQWEKINNPTQWPSFTIKSPIGASGDGVCEPRRVNCDTYLDGQCIQFVGGCRDLCTVGLETCPEKCKMYIKANGGDSGVGAQYRVYSRVYYSPDGEKDNISFDLSQTQSTLNIGSQKSITLKASGSGTNATLNGEVGINGAQGDDFVWPALMQGSNNFVSLNGDIYVATRGITTRSSGGEACVSKGSLPIYGNVTANSSIKYETQSLAINADFGLAGNPGSTEVKMIENIPTGIELRLYPAKNNDTEYSSIKIKDNDTGEWKDFLIASSGQTGALYTNYVLPFVEGDFPFPRSYYPDAFESKMPEKELWVASVNGYRSYLEKTTIKPGRSGYGAFPVVSSVMGIARHKINGVDTSTEVLRPIVIQMTNITCPNGKKSQEGIEGKNACFASKGDSGAVVITW